MAQSSLQEINDKLDQLLKYQKRARIWAWIKSICWLIIFIVFVGLPSYFAFDVWKNPGKYLDLSGFKQLQKQADQFMKQLQK